jgi:cytochrome P450
LFSIDMEREAAEVCGALHSILEQFRAQLDTAMLIPASIPTPSNLRMRRGLNRLEKVVEHIIEKRRKMSARPDDLLSALMYPEDPSSALSDRELRDEVITFLVAGHETTAVALTWAWYLLSNHPEANSRLLREIETQIGERSVCLDDLPVLHYARVVLLETLRLFPPAWTTPRRATEEVTIGSYVLPVGASVTMPQWVVHRDPRFFANPGSFIPERWLDNTIERLPRYAYFPFGGGRRGCIGEPFAMVEAVLILIAIAQRFRVQLKPGQEIKPWPTLTLHPDRAVKVHLKPRTSCAGNSQPV